MRTPHDAGVCRVMCKVSLPRAFSPSVGTRMLFASCNQIIRARYHLIQADRPCHSHLLSAENVDVIKPSVGCNQVATPTDDDKWLYGTGKPAQALTARGAGVNRMPERRRILQEANAPGKAWGYADVKTTCSRIKR